MAQRGKLRRRRKRDVPKVSQQVSGKDQEKKPGLLLWTPLHGLVPGRPQDMIRTGLTYVQKWTCQDPPEGGLSFLHISAPAGGLAGGALCLGRAVSRWDMLQLRAQS